MTNAAYHFLTTLRLLETVACSEPSPLATYFPVIKDTVKFTLYSSKILTPELTVFLTFLGYRLLIDPLHRPSDRITQESVKSAPYVLVVLRR